MSLSLTLAARKSMKLTIKEGTKSVHFQVNKKKPLGLLMDAYCAHRGILRSQLTLRYANINDSFIGLLINPNETCEDWDFKAGCILQARITPDESNAVDLDEYTSPGPLDPIDEDENNKEEKVSTPSRRGVLTKEMKQITESHQFLQDSPRESDNGGFNKIDESTPFRAHSRAYIALTLKKGDELVRFLSHHKRPLSGLMDAYCKYAKINRSEWIFRRLADGRIINPSDTCVSLGWTSSDVILVQVETVSSWYSSSSSSTPVDKKRKASDELELVSPPPIIRKKKAKVVATAPPGRVDAIHVFLQSKHDKSGLNYQIPISSLKGSIWEGYLDILSKCKDVISREDMQRSIDVYTRDCFSCLLGPPPRLHELYEQFEEVFDRYRVKSDSNVYSDDRSDCMKIVVADCKKYNFVDMIVLIRRNQALI